MTSIKQLNYWLVPLLLCWGSRVTALSCETNSQCQFSFLNTSECVAGSCSNPFLKGGCLKNLLPDWKRLRVCNSQDTQEDADAGHCRWGNEGLEHMEIRISSQNWESAFFESWVMQILLSELLDVPATIETGVEGLGLNFYDPDNAFNYGANNDWDALKNAATHLDCQNLPPSGEYQSCAHVIPEIWNGDLNSYQQEVVDPGYGEPVIALGALGHQSWFIPKFTARNDTSLLTYLGLVGDDNRRKLAETFKRPTTWGDYCDEVSPDNCSTIDGTALRAPRDDEERERMHVEGVYTGHFRATFENDCDNNPDCTGHIADFPCGWASYVKPQTYHLNISLASNGGEVGSNGYTYGQLSEMWAAANATKSHIMMQWWTPEALVQTFANSEFEFMRVNLPAATQECIDHRIKPEDGCVEDFQTQIGDPRGSCGEEPHLIQKAISTGLYKATFDSDIPESRRSPAYEAITNFKVTALQVETFFELWLKRNSDKWAYDPRHATCEWVVENFDLMQTFVPRSFPRVLVEQEHENVHYWVSLAFSFTAIILVLCASALVYKFRKNRGMKAAQIEFLGLVLFGLLCIGAGALVTVIPHSSVTCISAVWLITLGYTLELVPLVVKMGALNRMMQAAQQMKRVVVQRKTMFGAVLVLSLVTVVFLSAWTLFDPPSKQSDYELTSDMTENGETIVETASYCDSNSNLWEFAVGGFIFLYLMVACVLAFQTRKLPRDFNDSRSLGIMAYSQLIFIVARLATFALDAAVGAGIMTFYRSTLYSLDVIAVIFIYFYPKIWRAKMDRNSASNSAGGPVSQWESVHHAAQAHRGSLISAYTGGVPRTKHFSSDSPSEGEVSSRRGSSDFLCPTCSNNTSRLPHMSSSGDLRADSTFQGRRLSTESIQFMEEEEIDEEEPSFAPPDVQVQLK